MISIVNRVSKSILLIVGMLFISLSTVSAASPTGPYTAYKLKVVALISVESGALVYFDSNHQCGSVRAYIDGTRPDFKTVYSTLLAAQTTKLFVSVDLNDTTPGGHCNGSSSSIGNLCIGDENSPCFTSW